MRLPKGKRFGRLGAWKEKQTRGIKVKKASRKRNRNAKKGFPRKKKKKTTKGKETNGKGKKKGTGKC